MVFWMRIIQYFMWFLNNIVGTFITIVRSYKTDAYEPTVGGRLLPNGTFTGFVGEVNRTVSKQQYINKCF